jgi:zinc transport system ATP-binding protein
MSGPVMLEARDLRIAYGERTVLSGVNWILHAGELWFFIGPNGQGKTSFVRVLLGLLRPAGGTLARPDGLAAPARMGFVPQRCDLNAALPTSLRGFVESGLAGLRVSRTERAERLAWALAQVGMEGKSGMSYWALSGGQRQRALLARALVRRPTLLVLDEPTNGLDLEAESLLLDALERLHRAGGIAIVLVTHDLALAVNHATHVAVFHDGRLDGGPRDEVLAGPALRRAYGPAVALPEGMTP